MAQENMENIKEEDEITVEEVEVDSNLDAVKEEIKEQQDKVCEKSLQDLLKEKELESQDYQNRLQRLQADFINYKKRVEKEKSEIYQYGTEKIALDLLTIIDGLERALSTEDENRKDGFYEGIQLILKQFIDTLDKHGIKEIEALNKPFDLNLHHAVMKEETDVESNIVIEVFQKGYTIHNKVLRPTMVKVSS